MGSGIGTPTTQGVAPIQGAMAKLRMKLESLEQIQELVEGRLSPVVIPQVDDPEVPSAGKIQPACSALTLELDAMANRVGRVVERLEKLHRNLEL